MGKKIYTWNVNGIRACAKKGFLDWLKKEQPDILCLQETKAHKEQLSPEVATPEGYHTWFASAKKKGYSGVAIYSKKKPKKVTVGLGIPEFDDEGRTLVADYGTFILITSYFPNSQHEGKRLPYKLAYDKALTEYCEKLRQEGKEVIICGDFNAAHTEIDLENPKTNKKSAGFLPEERQWVSEMLALGYVDVYREQYPEENGHYTWWSYRSNARARNVGWRIDYFLTTPKIAKKVKEVTHLTDIMGSDHCPVRLELKGR